MKNKRKKSSPNLINRTVDFAAISIIIVLTMNPEGLKVLLQMFTLTLVTVIQHRKQRPQRCRDVHENVQLPLLFDDKAIN